MKTYKMTHQEVGQHATELASSLMEYSKQFQRNQLTVRPIRVYPIGAGGVSVSYVLGSLIRITVVDTPQEADCFVDDIIINGATVEQYCDEFPGVPFFALVDMRATPFFKDGARIVFPWHDSEEEPVRESDIVRDLLKLVGEDPSREGLSETPERVVKAWRHWCSGYGKDPAHILKVFEDGAEKYDQMVIVKDIPIYSHCEHHLAAIIGTASIAYIPNGKIVGLSKLSRLADMFARRLQVQERLTDQIADALYQHLQPKGVGVIIRARHLCMESRGVCQQGHHTITTALRGAIKDEPETRSEFLRLAE